ncbi:phosphotransferase enzyme family protein [Paludisphaera rhizosphaerae]|uniref:phosphotransferase enzyme family protein n=1 Tax=Paludisphaera rhizosphaerae TaxID=2711216 RepID=UPI0013EC3C2D|nr:phosphotransferase [Paludisphaera rhizosphaerae]
MSDESIREVLDQFPARERPLSEPVPLGGGGGLSGSRLWRFEAIGGARVLRVWPASVAHSRVERIHAWLRGVDLPFVPRPIAANDGSTCLWIAGRGWEVTPWLKGTPDMGGPPAVGHVRAAFEGLAAFHVRLGRHESVLGPSPGLLVHRDELRRLVGGGFDVLERAVAADSDTPRVRLAFEWLGLAKAFAPDVLAGVTTACSMSYRLQPCLRDARPEHFLFAGDALVGLVDFGAMDVETIAADLARLMGEWLPRPEGDELRDAGLSAYRRLRVLEPGELEAAAAFERLADVLIGERWVRWRFLERRAFEDQQAVADGLERGLIRLRRAADGR